MAKYSENPIPSSDINWNETDPTNGLPWSGKSIREFQQLKNKETENNTATKIGASYFDSDAMTLYQFASESDKDAWLEGGGDSYILNSVPFNFSGTLNQIVLTNRLDGVNLYFTTTSTEVILKVGIISQQKGITDLNWQDVNEDFSVNVDLDKGSTGKYTNILSEETVLNGNDFSIDVRKYLATGANRVRISVTGVDTGATKSLVYTLNLTTMYLSPSKFAWNVPFVEGSNYSLGGMNIGGSLSKVLKIKVTNTELNYEKLYEKNLGSQTYITSAYYYSDLEFPNTGTGVYNVEIWLDASGLESDHLNYRIMCIALSDANSAQLVAINEIPESALNYSDSTLFWYSIYNGGATVGSPSIKVSFGVETIVEETLSSVPTGVSQRYSVPLEIETESSDGRISFEVTNGNTETGELLLDNSASFPAVSDSVFYLNPASRSNVQANREVIINQADSTEYNATWTGLSWGEGVDGWTDDENGRNCLILPAGCGVNIDYKPLSTFPKGSKTIELSFRVTNVADYEEPIITMATEGDSWKGIKIYPKKIYVRSNLLKDDKSQSYPIKDEELVHVIITVVRDYKNYGNIAQIYVNGGTRCSFAFSGSDDFTAASNLIFGSSSSDLYIYKMRVYDSGFEWPGIVQNFINCLPGSEERVAVFEKMNKILDDSYNISYDAIKDTHNTMVIEMLDGKVLPDLLHPGGGQCNLIIDIKDPIPEELDSDFANLLGGQEILNQTIEGQGTTAMTYFRWNFRWKLDKTYNKRRITAKKNVASSMHSHKMGATRAYNDLHNEIVGLNEAGGRVAVYQYPVFGFTRTLNELGEWNYDFIGLYTVGPDKGDKTAFGFDSEQYKNTVIHMEGTDHTPMSVGMDYPWSELRYSAAKEGFGAVAKSGDIATAWEVGMAGDLSPDEASDEVEVMAMINTEFKPAYEVAYNNSPFILGVTETLEEINSQKTEWRKRTLESGKSYSELEFFTDGVFDLYYWNIQNETYQSNGVNLLTDLGISETEISEMTLEEKTQFFIEKRKERFTAQWGNYWNIQDVIYCYTFLMIFAATDNFKKNSYPYKFAALADGGRWCWRQDDLDTLGDINNQGFSSKVFSVLVGDTTSSGSVFRGDNSVFWSLVGMTQKEEIKKMVHSIFDAMKDKSPYGQSTLEKVSGYIRSVMWDYAQDYFGESAYNVDAGWTYEEAWKLRIDGKYNNDVDPLGQSLGSHYEAERDWFELRVLFIAAYYNYGPFATDNGDDTSTGQISFRASSGKTYTITPAIDFNPTILIGQSDLTTAGDRIMAGESVSIVVPDMGNNDTHVYIQGADWYTDLGDLKDIAVSTDNPVFTVSSKRLQNLKLGDEVAENVTSNIGTLNIGACPSLEVIDARNLTNLTGTIDLSKCPRLKKALFSGTGATEISLQPGSKIEEFGLPDTIATLSLINLPNLAQDNIELGTLQALTYLRIEGGNIDSFGVLEASIDNGVLKNIRLTGIDKQDGDSSDISVLSRLVDEGFFGINSDGSINDNIIPVIEGYIKIDGCAYEDEYERLKNAYGEKLIIEVTGGYYMRFADPEVLKVLLANGVGDGTGITEEQAASVTDIGTWFFQNELITSFNEFEKFTGVKILKGSGSSPYPGVFSKCPNLKSLTLPKSITTVQIHAINSTPAEYVVDLPNLSSVGVGAFTGSGVTEIRDLGNLTSTPNSTGTDSIEGNNGIFSRCRKLTKIILPEYSKLQTIGRWTFAGCSSLTDVDMPNVKSLDYWSFNRCSSLSSVNLPNVTSVGRYSFEGCPLKDINMPNLTSIDYAGFMDSSDSSEGGFVLNVPKLNSIGRIAFLRSNVLRVEDLGNITSTPDRENWSGVFSACQKLEYVNFEKLVTIGSYTCNDCLNLKEVILGENCTTINDAAFYNSPSLKYIFIKAIKPPTVQNEYTFGKTNNCLFYVPDGSVEQEVDNGDGTISTVTKTIVELYKEASGWSDYANRIRPMSEYDVRILTYNEDGNGGYKLYQIASYDTAKNDYVMGIAVKTQEHSFVIALKSTSSAGFGWYTTQYSDTTLYNGREATNAMLQNSGETTIAHKANAYVFANGTTGYIGSRAECSIAYSHLEYINSALNKVGGSVWTSESWTSTSYNNNSAYAYVFKNTGFVGQDKSVARGCRPFTELPEGLEW